jgi:hypothetical protein
MRVTPSFFHFTIEKVPIFMRVLWDCPRGLPLIYCIFLTIFHNWLWVGHNVIHNSCNFPSIEQSNSGATKQFVLYSEFFGVKFVRSIVWNVLVFWEEEKRFVIFTFGPLSWNVDKADVGNAVLLLFLAKWEKVVLK